MKSDRRSFKDKVYRKLKGILLSKISGTSLQFKLYPSYWHYKMSGNKTNTGAPVKHYMAQKPNYGAGIGHQLANWNAGYYFSKYYGLEFAHFPFADEKWEQFLGFGEGEVQAFDLIQKGELPIVRLPQFDSNSENEINLVGDIIKSYGKRPVLFLLELDQSFMRQYDTYADLSDKFFNARARTGGSLIYSPDYFNIAIHIRRGDIVKMKNESASNWAERWMDNAYYETVLKQVLAAIKTPRPVNIYIFSQGEQGDFKEFEQFENVNFCLDMDAINSFLHMTQANLLISSKSSFSYKPALISKGIVICPKTFWHGYPHEKRFVLADNDGTFDKDQLLSNLPLIQGQVK